MIGKVTCRVVPNSELVWAGGYPCGKNANSQVVHAVANSVQTFLCGASMSDFEWAKRNGKLTCKRCAAVIKRERTES